MNKGDDTTTSGLQEPLQHVYAWSPSFLGDGNLKMRVAEVAIVWHMYGMRKTTVYLPEDLKAALQRLAIERGSSEAALIREAIGLLTHRVDAPVPKLPLFRAKGPPIAERVDEELADGFGVE